jgi:cytoskeletal protein RodZ
LSIGEVLADARRRSGLTVTQVSQRTCIRETIIRGIERGDFSACGGDFYARGHIRSIAHAVGTDPDPLIREYDSAQGAPQAITAADVFEPSTPIKLKERRRPNWSLAMLAVLAIIVGLVTYHFVSAKAPANPAASGHHSAKSHHHVVHPSTKPTPASDSSPATSANSHKVVIVLTTAANEVCWVDLTVSTTGKQLFQGDVNPVTTETWTAYKPVTLELGNPGAVTLTVNGKNESHTSLGSQPVTLTISSTRVKMSLGVG